MEMPTVMAAGRECFVMSPTEFAQAFGMVVMRMRKDTSRATFARSMTVHMIKWRDEGYDETHEKKRKQTTPRKEPEEATHL
jgi:hypothetical protein